jgi:hypothetical protein
MDLIKKNTILKQNTDKYTKYLCAFILMHLSVFQMVAQAPITVEGQILTPLTTGTSEGIDTVTVGATMPYYVYPDFDFNPSFIESTPLDSSKIDSKFFWSSDAGYVVNTVNATDPENYKNITWNTAATYLIKVTEKTAATYGGCTGDYSFSVVVLPKPTAAFSTAATLACPQTAATTVYVPLTVSSGVKGTTEEQMKFTFTYTYNGVAQGAIASEHIAYAEGTGTISVGLQALSSLPEGRYVFTLTAVSDRISRKCSVDGTLISPTTYTVYVTSPKPTLKTSATK